MGHGLAATVNLFVLSLLSAYMGINPIILPFHLAQDFHAGLSGEPAEMRYRPSWQNFALRCGTGGECDD